MSTPKSVNDLPAEILGMVFFEFLEEEAGQESRRQHPGRLICVCRLWKELVEGNSVLWSRVDVTLGNDTTIEVQPISNKIRKAKRFPLALHMHCGNPGFIRREAVTRDVLALYGLIKDHRWRGISIFKPGYILPFEIIFRHIVDHPQMCQLSYFHMGDTMYLFNDNVIRTLAMEALRQNPSITHLAVPMDFLEPPHPVHPVNQVVSYLQLTGVYTPTSIFNHIREASSLRSLRVECLGMVTTDPDDLPSPCTLSKLEYLSLRTCHGFPKLLLQTLDLPRIWDLTLGLISCNIKQGDQQLKGLISDVPWLTRIKSLNLEE
ncbi:hypothetical protein FRB94_013639, partial [Tulasnella sp. JGI-2019a]